MSLDGRLMWFKVWLKAEDEVWRPQEYRVETGQACC